MKGLIITNAYAKNENYLNQPKRLQKEFAILGAKVDVMPLDTSMCGISSDGKAVFSLKGYDFCVFFDKDPYALQIIEKCGIRCFNSYSAMSLCDDKALTFLKLANNDVPMPATYFSPLCYVQNAEIPEKNFDFLIKKLGLPMIVKECYGSLGKGVELVSDKSELISTAERLKFIPHMYQKYIAESCGTDVRVIVIGGKFVGAMKRISGGDFRSNIASGGRGEVYPPDEKLISLSEKISALLGLDYCGIDFLLSKNGYVLCEVNSNAFFKEFEKVTRLNVAAAYAKHILSSV